jgi:hypothetical protein
MPKGIPIIVIINNTLETKYPIEVSRPPKTSHTIFPSTFIIQKYKLNSKMN